MEGTTKMSQATTDTILSFVKLRNLLDGVSQTSWAFSVINKRNPIDSLSEDDAVKVIDAYKDLITRVKRLLDDYQG
jgi:hypothetical protein